MEHPEKSLQELLGNQINALPGIKAKVQQLLQLNKIWRAQLAPTLALHCRVANLREKCLIIEVDSAAWVTHLRYAIPELLKQLRLNKEFSDLQAIEWYINPTPVELAPTRKPLVLSKDSKKLIHETAQSISSEALKKALGKLGGN